MTLKKVCLFPSMSAPNGVIDVFTSEMAEALKRQGVDSHIIEVDRGNPSAFLKELLTDPPDCTLSFNGLLPDEEGKFLCDLIKIPHVACLTHAPTHYFTLIRSPLNIITCIDKNFCKVFTDLRFSNVLFLTHAANYVTEVPKDQTRKYEILALNSYIDYEAIHQTWAKRYSPELCKVLDEAASLTQCDFQKPYLEAFIETLDRHLRQGKTIDPRQIDYEIILEELEFYIVGKSRIELFKSIETGHLHIFGSGSDGWRKELGSKPNIHIHEPVHFEEALELMKQAKIILNCTPQIKQGLHERILNGLARGALVLTQDNPYLREQFKNEENILLFACCDYSEVNQKIETYLNDEPKRALLAERGRQEVLKNHTWDQRATFLIKELPAILDQLKVEVS